MTMQGFDTTPLLGILRGITLEQVNPVAEASIKAGLKAIEVTMNTSGAPRIIEQMRMAAGGSMTVGAGTVLTLDSLRLALDAGAQFIVMPVSNGPVIEFCNDNNIPVFPGALTPSEIYSAWQQGATQVKVFPASVFGPSYLKEVKAPLNDIKLMACGGVSVETIGDFFKNGASSVAFGSSIYRQEWMDAGNYERIAQEIELLIDAYRQHAT